MKLWEKNVRRVIPYTPGEQPSAANVIKLNTNENPYPPAPGVTAAKDAMDAKRLRLYPDPTAKVLVDALAHYYDVGADQVFVGVGSDDVLSVAFLTFFNSEKPVLFPDITYSFYPVWAQVYRIPYETCPLDENFRINPEDYYRENGGIVFPNPNAPTACYESLDKIEDILDHNRDVVVIVDEAYIDFGGKSALELIKKYDNLLVVQTFSKSRSMAGIRIGYAMGCPELIKAMNDVKYSINSYTMNMPSLIMGVEAVKDETYFSSCTQKIIATRQRAKERLSELGFEFPDSMANFIFARHPKYHARELFEALRSANIFVRYFNQPRIDEYMRITIGTDDQMDALFDFLKNYMDVNKKKL
ncbi:histidinol-phosphate aminotransferase [Catenibacillus scindens]|uniref:Histidinol-phosphate aminotransferase n=1 Tax=Catenibacillus scindens TaxID=673271 RepID=A0A7W8HBX6_9FIRM|nr:histidinol-phosphate transaminase [Catenibacillus scindens]MBB5265666.1 histidinol-phosphate aminotransferase [Catenibacillus scindens]